MDQATTVASRAGLLVAVALFAISCTESVGPERSRYTPSFSYAANGITLNQANGAMGYNGQLIIKGFNPTNPHRGDAIIASFFWVGSTFIIDSVVDILTTNPYTRVGNKYTLVDYVTAGGYSMATYVATNVQGFPDPNTDPGQGDILAVGAYLSQPVKGGVTLSTWTGVADDATLARGNFSSKSGTGTEPVFAHADPISVNAGALVYTVTMSGLWGLERPQGYASTGQGGSDATMKQGVAFAVQTAAGTVDPQWGWFFGPAGDTWLVTTLALNRAPSPQGNLTASTSTSGASIDPDGYMVTVAAAVGDAPDVSQAIPVTGSVTFSGLAAGDRRVTLSGLATNCTVSGANPQTVSVSSGGTATAAFSVTCAALPGDLTVNTTSSGSSIPSTYSVSVDGGPGQTIASTGSATFTALSATSHSVALSVPSNCTVSGDASRTVTVPAAGTATVSYVVNCVTPPGNLGVNTTSTGANIPSSYTATVDGTQNRTIPSSGSVTFTNLSAAAHTLVLSVPANCTVSGGPSRTVTVPSGGTITVSYAVNCNAPPVVNAGPDQTALTGLLYSLNWSFTDANHNGPWTYTINWGDGTTSSGTVSSEGSFSRGHTYVTLLPRNFTVRVTVRDASGAAASDTKVVSVIL
jgi:hypothetical protein